MQNIHIKSLGINFSDYRQYINRSLSYNVSLSWSFQEVNCQWTVKELMNLLVEGVDFVLVSQSQLIYPFPDQLQVIGVFRNGHDAFDPIVLLALNPNYDEVFKAFDNDLRKQQGRVDIAGFGPGDPDLLTVKTHCLIQEADVIYYDDLLDNTYLDQFAAEKVYVGKRKGQHSTLQDDINRLLYASAAEGKKVLRLKGGDPLVFGRGSEEYHYLKRRFVEVEIIPGITSALAAASDAVAPLTERGVSTSVAFVLGHDAENNKLPKADTLVFYMGASQQKKWAQRLVQSGWADSTPVAVVCNASLPTKKVMRYTLGQLLATKVVLPAPALLIVGQTASTGAGVQKKKWLYTGTDINFFKEEGFAVHNPMVAIQPLEPSAKGQEVMDNLVAFDRIVFASPFAVREFFAAIDAQDSDVRIIANHQLTSIGASTSAELKKHGLVVVPESSCNSAEGLIKSFKSKGVTGESILLPCSDKGLSKLPAGLKKLGNFTYQLKLYRAVRPENVVRHNLDHFFGIVFSSPTAVHHFFQLHKSFPSSLKIVVRGKYTKELVMYYLKTLKLTQVITVEEQVW